MKCPQCDSTDIDIDSSRGDSACMNCGYIMAQNAIVSEIGFVEGANGASSVIGQFVPSTGGSRLSASAKGRGPGGRGPSVGYHKDSREHTIQNGRRAIQQVADHLRLRAHHVDSAVRLFMLAVQHNFIQGRRTSHVVASCLYIVCRREKTPHLLIDFSDVMQINLYVLGATFLKFVRLLNLSLPIIDPSLYIHRFAAQLELKDEHNRDKTHMVAMTALRLVARMKRDWMLIGRRPSGICGACLLIAARIHGFKRTQKEIIYIVRICDMTLRRRLIEFANTHSSQLTLEEFESMDVELINNSKAMIEAENKERQYKEGPDAPIKEDPYGIEQDPPAYTRNRIAEREATNILLNKARLQGQKEELLKELGLDTDASKEGNLRRLVIGQKQAAASSSSSTLMLPPGSGQPGEDAHDAEIRAIQAQSRQLLEFDAGASAKLVAQIEQLMSDRSTGFSSLDEGPQKEVLGNETATSVHVTPMPPGMLVGGRGEGEGEAAAASSSSSTAAASSSPARAVPSPAAPKERLKSIHHKGPNLSQSRSRPNRSTPAPAAAAAAPSLLLSKDTPQADLTAILTPRLAPTPAPANSLQFAMGNPLADAMLLAASDPTLHQPGGAAASSSSSSSSALLSTPVEPDLSKWDDFSEFDEEIESSILLSSEESAFKTQAWEQINKDYLAEQEEKKALIAAAAANGQAIGPDGNPLPRRTYRKKVKAGPASTAAEATMRLLADKKYSDKINYNALQGLLAKLDDGGGGEGATTKKEDKKGGGPSASGGRPLKKITEEDEEDEEDEDLDDEDIDVEDEEEEEEDIKPASALLGKRGASSLHSQLPSAKQQRRSMADEDDDDADEMDEDDDEDRKPMRGRRGHDEDEEEEPGYDDEDY